ncbi:MAG: hypothetical protein EOP52_03145 [Sphingobacteriales bacterium]|nr:MAG: hypothetical protein EOP52_03145 [Sphingobacteriales bacterium]
MKPENYAEINRKYSVFFGAFLALLLFSLLCIFFLFRHHKNQLQRIGEAQASLNSVQNQQLLLSDRMDHLLKSYQLVNTDGVENSSYLIDQISNDRDEMEHQFRKGDTAAFPVYGRLLRETKTSLLVKDSINELISREAFLKASLSKCIESYQHAARPKPITHNSSRFR